MSCGVVSSILIIALFTHFVKGLFIVFRKKIKPAIVAGFFAYRVKASLW